MKIIWLPCPPVGRLVPRLSNAAWRAFTGLYRRLHGHPWSADHLAAPCGPAPQGALLPALPPRPAVLPPASVPWATTLRPLAWGAVAGSVAAGGGAAGYLLGGGGVTGA